MRRFALRLASIVFRVSLLLWFVGQRDLGLRLDDARWQGDRPHLGIRNDKGGKSPAVPLWWNAGTLADIGDWKAERGQHGATGGDPLVCSMLANRRGQRLDRHALRLRFQRACGVLGDERRVRVTIHHGRHSFVSHALAGGRTLAEVRDAAGHSNVSITSVYLHTTADDDGVVGHLFRFD